LLQLKWKLDAQEGKYQSLACTLVVLACTLNFEEVGKKKFWPID